MLNWPVQIIPTVSQGLKSCVLHSCGWINWVWLLFKVKNIPQTARLEIRSWCKITNPELDMQKWRSETKQTQSTGRKEGQKLKGVSSHDGTNQRSKGCQEKIQLFRFSGWKDQVKEANCQVKRGRGTETENSLQPGVMYTLSNPGSQINFCILNSPTLQSPELISKLKQIADFVELTMSIDSWLNW